MSISTTNEASVVLVLADLKIGDKIVIPMTGRECHRHTTTKGQVKAAGSKPSIKLTLSIQGSVLGPPVIFVGCVDLKGNVTEGVLISGQRILVSRGLDTYLLPGFIA